MTKDDKADRHRSLYDKSAKNPDPSQKNRLSVAPSLASQLTETSNASFHELVTIDNEGHPYIDINRLIYRPTQQHLMHQHDTSFKKEKCTWYVPDFAFIVFNLIGLGVSTYFCLIGASTLTWKASIGMFSVPICNLTNDDDDPTTFQYYPNSPNGKIIPKVPGGFYYRPCKTFTDPETSRFFTEESNGYNWKSPNSFPILRTKLTDVHYFGLVLICIEVVNLINVIVGINACLQGYKAIMIQHIAVDGLIIMGEFIISAVVAFTSTCELRDIRAIRVVMENFVRWYGTIVNAPEDETDKEKLINQEVDALQIGLGCCGVDGWTDYLAAAFPNSDWHQSVPQLDDVEMVIPFSCCRSWWIRNIYCSHGVHNWAHPLASEADSIKFQERIVPEGCLYKLEKLCLNLRAWMGNYGFVATLMHLICIIIEAIAALVLIKNINTLIREKKKMERHKEMFHDDAGSELDFSAGRKSMSSREGGKASQWSKVPPPTEDEILMIKQRSNFNSFMAKAKNGFVGKWMKEAQGVVTEGHEDGVEEYITAEERKQREKELLHGNKAKQAQQKGVQGGQKQEGKANLVANKQKNKKGHNAPSHKVVAKKPEPQEVVRVVIEPGTEASDSDPEEKPDLKDKPESEDKPEAEDKPGEEEDKRAPIDDKMLLKPPEMKKKKSLTRKKTKTLFKKSKSEVKPVESKTLHKKSKREVKPEPVVPVEEPPPLTEDESGVESGVMEATSETKSMKRRRRRKKKKLQIIEKRQWQGSWFW